jgi:transposase
MGKAYSKDLRKRVIEYIEEGNNYTSASSRYNISRETARKWHIRYKTEGHYDQKPRKGKKSRIIRTEFENYVKLHSGATLAQIGSHFKMTARSVHYYMEKFGFVYKKKSLAIWKQRHGKEENIYDR